MAVGLATFSKRKADGCVPSRLSVLHQLIYGPAAASLWLFEHFPGLSYLE